MKTLLVAALLAVMAVGATSVTFIHVHRTSPTQLGVTCSNGNNPIVLGKEESTVIISCDTPAAK